MQTYDKFEQLAAQGKLTTCVLGNPQTEEFELFPLDNLARYEACIRDGERRSELLSKGYSFLGVCGLVNGTPRSAFSEGLGPTMTTRLAQAYLQLVLNSPQFVPVFGRGWVN
jgi:hypothetical protein